VGVEQTILEHKATTLAELKAQVAVLAQRNADGADISEDLAALAA
jgi:hypothetical protein